MNYQIVAQKCSKSLGSPKNPQFRLVKNPVIVYCFDLKYSTTSS